MSSIFKSYIKTTILGAVCATAFSLVAASAYRWVPFAPLAAAMSLLAAFLALAGVTTVCAGLVVVTRYVRAANGKHDLFLLLNHTRDVGSIKASPPPTISSLRRWLAVRLLRHNFIVGDLVEIKSWPEIRATLDDRGRHEELPFMPEMRAMCGQRARVFRCMHRLFDYRKSRKMRHMDGTVLLADAVCNGSKHGGCDAMCHTIWKSVWLRHVSDTESALATPPSSGLQGSVDEPTLNGGIHPPRYSCQLTQLNNASMPTSNGTPESLFGPLVARNVTVPAFLIAHLTNLFNEVQHWRGGVQFPAFEPAVQPPDRSGEVQLKAGDVVIVRTSGEIRATLNDRLEHKGMGFEPDMLKHCGHRYRVQREITKVIDIVSGEMRTMKTRAYVLHGVHFSGERQLFNSQYEPLFWRNVWLARERT